MSREGNAEDDLSGDAQGFAARRQDRQLRRRAEQHVREPGRRRQQVLAVVEDEQQCAASDEVDQGVDDVLCRQRPHVQRICHGVGDEPPICDRSELDERSSRLERRLDRAPELQRQSRLADASRPRERQQPCPAEQRLELGKLPATPDERARLRGKRERRRRSQRFPLLGELGRQRRELFTTCLGPVVVAVLRQQLPAVQGEGGAVGTRRLHPPRLGRRRLQRFDVDLGSQSEHLLADVDRIGSQRAPRHVHRLVQVVRGRRRREVAPQHVHHLLAVQPMTMRKSEQLHELTRLLQPPGAGRDRDAVDRSGEPTEQGHGDRHRAGQPSPRRSGRIVGG
jgi:hypothetical protein